MSPKTSSDLMNDFVERYLHDAKDEVRCPKVIHECIWGTHLYEKWEIVFLDTPLIQRLRDIRQTGLGYLTFPTATHSRFDHTIGTITQCSKFSEVLAQKNDLIGPEQKRRLRLAALFHDIGHCVFSHASEEVYGLLPDMQAEIGPGKTYERNAPHEVLTLKILQTDAFSNFYNKVITKYEVDCTIPQMESLILGTEEPLSKYKSDILNGPFDADKIDYLFRDGQFSGIPLIVDLDRLWYATDIKKISYNGIDWRRLAINYSGTSPLEQILFDRVQLYPSLYHHQKVRASVCMLKGIIEYIHNNKVKVSFGRQNGVKFNTIVDFLSGTELDFFAMATQTSDNILHKLIHDLQYRRLLKRAVTISRNTVENDDGFDTLMAFRHEYKPELHNRLREVAKHICEEAIKQGIECNVEQIWIDLPAPPKVTRDIDRAYVILPDDNLISLAKVFPISQWLELYDLHKWHGHVFVPNGTEQKIAGVVKAVLAEEFNLTIKDEGFTSCHLTAPNT